MNQNQRQVSAEDQVVQMVSSIVSSRTGVILGERQRGMVQGRMVRRIREVGCRDYEDYLVYLNQNKDKEAEFLVSLLTTHHTFFFREFEHFEFLLNDALPKLIENSRKERRKLRFMSAACSKGHEVYTIAMFLKAHLPADVDFEIVGGDICQESVDYAKNGVYRWDEVKTIPANYLTKNWARGTGKIENFAKVTDRIRKHCQFQILNLVELNTKKTEEAYDVIFCRNVFIYFDRDQVRKSAQGLIARLRKDGHLIVGLSESLNGMELPIEWEGPSVYRMVSAEKGLGSAEKVVASAPRPAVAAAPSVAGPAAQAQVSAASPSPKTTQAQPIQIFSIDDSPTVLKLMQKLAGESGFQYLGSAKDGREALNVLTGPNAPKPSVITLDLHMPVMNGLEFLKEFRKVSKIPVVLVSSINREEQTLAQAALAAGANDYVEKPALDRWKETSAELSSKIRSAARMTALASSPALAQVSTIDLSIDRAFSEKPAKQATLRRWVIVSDEASKGQALEFAKRHRDRVECVVLSGPGAGSKPKGFSQSNSSSAVSPTVPKSSTTNGPLEPIDLDQAKNRLALSQSDRAILVFGELSAPVASFVARFGKTRTLVEERVGALNQLKSLRSQLGDAVDVFPVFSFAYEADRQIVKRDSAA